MLLALSATAIAIVVLGLVPDLLVRVTRNAVPVVAESSLAAIYQRMLPAPIPADGPMPPGAAAVR